MLISSDTSGTTGNPKGVVLTHGAITSAVIANAYNNDKFEKGWVFCSYLRSSLSFSLVPFLS